MRWRMSKAVVDEVTVLWAEHLGPTFPDDLKGLEGDGEPVRRAGDGERRDAVSAFWGSITIREGDVPMWWSR